MLPRERVLKAIAHEETDRVPMDFQGTYEVAVAQRVDARRMGRGRILMDRLKGKKGE